MNCIILKSNDDESSKTSMSSRDRYVDFLSSASNRLNRIVHINPLRFEYINEEKLKQTVEGLFGGKELKPTYKALILTSRQTVEAMERSLFGSLSTDVNSNSNPQINVSDSIQQSSGKLIVYCVGDSTRDRFLRFIWRVKTSSIDPNITDRIIVRTGEALGDEAVPTQNHKQNAEYLSRVILNDYPMLMATRSCQGGEFSAKFAFYPCSTIRKDDLSKRLKEAGIDYEELCVYQTSTNNESMNQLNDQLSSMINEEEKRLISLVFFSPSGVDAVWSSVPIRALIEGENPSTRFRLISIGPSTTHRLKHLFGDKWTYYELSKPSPDNLLAKLNEITI